MAPQFTDTTPHSTSRHDKWPATDGFRSGPWWVTAVSVRPAPQPGRQVRSRLDKWPVTGPAELDKWPVASGDSLDKWPATPGTPRLDAGPATGLDQRDKWPFPLVTAR